MAPWKNEPDADVFESHGLLCKLRRNGSRAWCGYVGLPKSHPLFGKSYSDTIKAPKERIERTGVDCGVFPIFFAAFASDAEKEAGIFRLDVLLDVHGGITFAENHPAGEDEDGRWWLGFDCNHAGDASPDDIEDVSGFRKRHPEFGPPDGEYRTHAYAKAQAERLAKQLSEWPTTTE